MIELKNVTKAYGNKTIFSKLSFRIDTGEFVVFSGKSGCGKSTMLSLIGGIEKATSGQIIVDGTDITNNYNRIKYFSEKVAFLFQNFALSENKTVKQNLEMVPKKSRSGVSIPDALKAVGIDKENTNAVIDILKKLNTENGKTVIMVTHDEELKKVGDRIINM